MSKKGKTDWKEGEEEVQKGRRGTLSRLWGAECRLTSFFFNPPLVDKPRSAFFARLLVELDMVGDGEGAS